MDRAAERAGKYFSNSKEASGRLAGPPKQGLDGAPSCDCDGPRRPDRVESGVPRCAPQIPQPNLDLTGPRKVGSKG